MPPADTQQQQNNQAPQTAPPQPNAQQPVQGVSVTNQSAQVPVQNQIPQQNAQINRQESPVNIQTPEMQVNPPARQVQMQQQQVAPQAQNQVGQQVNQTQMVQPQVQQQVHAQNQGQIQSVNQVPNTGQVAQQPNVAAPGQQPVTKTDNKSLTQAKKAQTAEQMNMEKFEKKNSWMPKITGKMVSMVVLLILAGVAGYTHYNDPTYFPNEAKTFLNGDFGNQFATDNLGRNGSISWNSSNVVITEDQLLDQAKSSSNLVDSVNITPEKIQVVTNVAGEITPEVPLWLVFNLVPAGENGVDGLRLQNVTFGREEVQPSLLGEVIKKELVKLAQIPEAETAELAVLQLLFAENYSKYASATTLSLNPSQLSLSFTAQQDTTTTSTNSNNSNNAPSFDPSNSNSLPAGLQEALENEESKRDGIDQGLGDAQQLLDEAGYEVDVENFGDNFGDGEEEN